MPVAMQNAAVQETASSQAGTPGLGGWLTFQPFPFQMTLLVLVVEFSGPYWV